MRLYYAHDIRVYGTEAEIEALQRIAVEYPKAEIINPATDIEQPTEGRPPRKVMEDCLEEVSKADILVFSAYEDSYIRNGVKNEIAVAKMAKIPVLYLEGETGRFVPLEGVEFGLGALGESVKTFIIDSSVPRLGSEK